MRCSFCDLSVDNARWRRQDHAFTSYIPGARSPFERLPVVPFRLVVCLMEPFVQQLAELCRVHVTRCKWVFVPSHAIGRTIGECIALSEDEE